jgi:hypothetical protein
MEFLEKQFYNANVFFTTNAQSECNMGRLCVPVCMSHDPKYLTDFDEI